MASARPDADAETARMFLSQWALAEQAGAMRPSKAIIDRVVT